MNVKYNHLQKQTGSYEYDTDTVPSIDFRYEYYTLSIFGKNDEPIKYLRVLYQTSSNHYNGRILSSISVDM